MTVLELGVNDSRNLDIPKLLEKCEELLCRFEYELALKFCEKILLAEPNHVEALIMKAMILIDISDTSTAKKAVSVEPEQGVEKYIALAQLCEGDEALNYFQKARVILDSYKADDDIKTSLKNRQIASIYCSMVEIYMTDLCLRDDAEQKCEIYINSALQIYPNNYEALQTMANMKISQNKTAEAVEVLDKAMSLWTIIPFEDDDFPSFEFRLVCSRLLVELGQFGKARNILETLSQEDDEIIEVWYLLALALYSMEMYEDAKLALENAVHNQPSEIFGAILELQEVLGMNEDVEDRVEDSSTLSDDAMEI